MSIEQLIKETVIILICSLLLCPPYWILCNVTLLTSLKIQYGGRSALFILGGNKFLLLFEKRTSL